VYQGSRGVTGMQDVVSNPVRQRNEQLYFGGIRTYQVDSRTDGADVPQHIMNVAK
jgi:hypothetical protein